MIYAGEGQEFLIWWRDLLDRASSISNMAGATELLRVEAANLGFDYYAYIVKAALPFTKSRIESFGNIPSDWMNRHLNSALFNSKLKINLFRVDEGYPDSIRQRLDKKGQKNNCAPQFCAARSRVGAKNSTCAVLFGGEYEEINDEQKTELDFRMSCILEAMIRIPKDMLIKPNSSISLSAREIEILQWTADGKSTDEVALILGISGNTVNFHIKNVQKKLGTCNKLSATAVAAALGII